MSQINDEIILATGGPTINDGLATWFSKTTTESLQDAEARWLVEQGAQESNVNDMWYSLLNCAQSLNDCLLDYWTKQATPTPVTVATAETSVDGLSITVTFSDYIAGTAIAADFTTAPVKTITAANGLIKSIVLTVSVAFIPADVITLSFVDTQATNITDFALFAVTNNVV